MNKKNLLLLITVLCAIVLVNSSCKKQQQTTVAQLLSTGTWQLASIKVTYTNKLVTTYDTLNTNCNLLQSIIFKSDNTCTYANFDCIQQQANGHWQLSTDQLTLAIPDMTCQDTTKAGSSKPFVNAQLINAGQYSLVIQTGDYNIIPTTTNSTKVIRYGFIRQNKP